MRNASSNARVRYSSNRSGVVKGSCNIVAAASVNCASIFVRDAVTCPSKQGKYFLLSVLKPASSNSVV